MKITRLTKKALTLTLALFLIFFSAQTYAQGITINGTVTDENDSPLPGVNILIAGKSIGTISNISGYYTINATGPEDVIVFSFVGYNTVEERVGSRTLIDIRLEPDFSELDEVVVIGYGTQKKSDLTGSVIKISSDELQSTPIVNAADALKGRAAGVMVSSNSGQPGTSPTIRIRGESSILAGNAPLIIIDGMPGGDLGSLNMNDIESFEILKDAAAASIYGSAGANGVILITTKRGKSGESRIDFNAKFGTRHFPEFHEVLNSEQAFEYLKEILPTMHNFSDQYHVDWDAITNSTLDTTNFVDINWQDMMFDVGTFQEYALSFSSGNDKLTYRISGSYLRDEGIIKPSSYDRYTFRANVDNKLTDRITVSSDLSVNHTYRIKVNDAGLGWNGGMVNSALQFLPFIPVYDDFTGYMFPNPIRPQVDSPYALANGVNRSSYGTGINGNFKITIDLIKGLKFRSEWFADAGFSESKSFRDRRNTYDGRTYNGVGSGSTGYSTGLTFHNILQYENEFNGHNFFIMAGQIAEKTMSRSMGISVIDFPSDYMVLLQQANNRESISDGIGEFKKYSFISRLNYSYNNKYLLQINMRADGSPKFGPANRWGYFPSGSIGWKISEEDFMENISAIDMAKFRFGIGNTGNDQIPAWQWMSTYGSGNRSLYDIYGNDQPVSFYSPARMVNPDLKWESTIDYSLGLDLMAYRKRIDASVDLYIRDSYDLLYNKPIPYTSGFPSIFYNLGKVRNSGVELLFTTYNISRPDFSWKTNLNFAYNKNLVVDIGGENEASYGRWSIVENQPLRMAWLYEIERLFQYEDFNLAGDNYVLKPEYALQTNAQPGDIKFVNQDDPGVDSDGEPIVIIDNNDRIFMGTSMPPVIFGMSNTLSYKGIGLTVFIQGVSGNKIYNETRVYSEGMNDYFNQFTTILDRWTPENTNTTMPRASHTDLNGNIRESDRWLEDGSYIRVKDITLSYQLSKKLLSSIGMKTASIYVTGQNLYTLTKYSGYDPEVGYNDNGTYPQVRSIIFGLNVSL